MTGSCHCGKVSVRLARRPAYINLCDCSLCLKSGGAWGYFDAGDVDVTGATQGYRRADYPRPGAEMRFCPQCGATINWAPIAVSEYHTGPQDTGPQDTGPQHAGSQDTGSQLGVNMRLFEPDDLAGIETRTLDGRGWFGTDAVQNRRAPGKLGEDVFL